MSENVYNNFTDIVAGLLIDNIGTISTQSQCLQMWTNTNQALTTAWTSAPVATLANPNEAWDPVSNPYVPCGCTYYPNGDGPDGEPDYGDVANSKDPYNPETNPFEAPYDANDPPPGCDNQDQINMVNALNTTTDPDSMNDFLTTYANTPYEYDWSQSFGTLVLDQAQLDPDPDNDSTTASGNLQLINSWLSLVSSNAQEQEAAGHTLISMLQNLIQNSGSAQQTIADAGTAVAGVESNIASLLQQAL